MTKLTNRHLLPFYLTLAAVAAHATPTLTFGTITGTQAPGNTITVNVLLTNNGAAVSGINFDLTYASGLTVSSGDQAVLATVSGLQTQTGVVLAVK